MRAPLKSRRLPTLRLPEVVVLRRVAARAAGLAGHAAVRAPRGRGVCDRAAAAAALGRRPLFPRSSAPTSLLGQRGALPMPATRRARSAVAEPPPLDATTDGEEEQPAAKKRKAEPAPPPTPSAKTPTKTPPAPKPKPKKPKAGPPSPVPGSLEPPLGWRSQYEIVKELRAILDAPVGKHTRNLLACLGLCLTNCVFVQMSSGARRCRSATWRRRSSATRS
jgi:hypothetical protein